MIRVRYLVVAVLLAGCGPPTEDHGHDHDDGWAVTAWGDHFEIFAEADPLMIGQTSRAHTHVTFLYDFSAVGDGVVEAVLVGEDGTESTFRREEALRPGIFDIPLAPTAEGAFELRFRVEAQGFSEVIPAGRVRVGTTDHPGGRAEAEPAHEHAEGEDHDHHANPDPTGVGGVSFLKEQQWETRFGTIRAENGEIHLVVGGPGRLRPFAGRETALTASLDGEVVAPEWPHVGMRVEAGTAVFALAPRGREGRSLAELEAQATETEAALALARERLVRLEGLLEVQATSTAELEAARSLVVALTAQHQSAARSLQAARGGRNPSGRGQVQVTAPFPGRIAEVRVTPGQSVSAGEILGLLVQADPFWVEVRLHPWESTRLGGGVEGLLLRGPATQEPVRFESGRVRLVAIAPVVDERTGTLTCTFEVQGSDEDLPLGSYVEAEVVLADTRSGIVIPSSAVVDDAGVPVVYVQSGGESFMRREIRIRNREGDRLLVEGLAPGERVVTEGGATIRRASMVATDVGHGHVH